MDSIQKTFVTSPIRQLLGAVGKNQGACSTQWNFSRTSADCRRDSFPEERTDQVNSMTNRRQLKKHTGCFNVREHISIASSRHAPTAAVIPFCITAPKK